MTEILIGNQRLPTVLGDNGREYVTFVPERDMDMVELLSDCLGKARFKKIQIEANDEATDFVVPQVYEGKLSGIFKDLKELNLELTDTANSDLWAKIKINNRGWLEEYHKSNISTEIVKSAEGIQAEFRNAQAGLEATLTRTAEGLQSTLADTKRGLETRITETARGISEEISDSVAGLRTEITRSAQGVRTDLSNQISGISSSQQVTASALTQEIRDRQGAVSQLTQRVDGIGTRVTSAEGNYSTLLQKANGLESRVSNAEGTISSNFTQLKGLIDQRVTQGDVATLIRQSGDSIKLAIQDAGGIKGDMTASEIALTLNQGVIKLKGSIIDLEGTTLSDNFVAQVAKIINLDAGRITTGRINVQGLIETEAITGDKIKFDQAFFNKLTANEAYLAQLFAKDAFINRLRAVDISGTQISGGYLKSINGTTNFDMQSGLLNFNSNNTGIFRVEANASTTGMMFLNDPVTVNGNRHLVSRAIIGAERRGNDLRNAWMEGGFNGMIIETIRGINAADHERADLMTLVSDSIRFTHSYQTDTATRESPTGWEFKNYGPASDSMKSVGQVALRPINIDPRASQIYVGDIKFMKNKTDGVWARQLLLDIIGLFEHYRNGGFTDNTMRAMYNGALALKSKIS